MRGVDAATGSAARSTGVGVLDRAVAILDAVERTPMGSSELARHLGLSVPTAHRLAAAMVAHGLLRRDSAGRHHLGHRFAASSLAALATPVLEDLCGRTGETGQIWVPRGDERLCLVSVESDNELRASLPVGTVLPLSAGGSAALVLTAPPPDPVGTRPGWVESVGKRTPGLCSVSAGVLLDGEIVAAVCLSAPIARVHPDGPGAQYGELVVQAADRISSQLSQR